MLSNFVHSIVTYCQKTWKTQTSIRFALQWKMPLTPQITQNSVFCFLFYLIWIKDSFENSRTHVSIHRGACCTDCKHCEIDEHPDLKISIMWDSVASPLGEACFWKRIQKQSARHVGCSLDFNEFHWMWLWLMRTTQLRTSVLDN